MNRISPITHAICLALGLSASLLPSAAGAALPPDSVIKVDGGVQDYEINTTEDLTGFKHRSGISIVGNSSAVFNGASLTVETLDYGIYLEDSSFQIANPDAVISLAVETNNPNAAFNSRAFAFYLSGDSQTNINADSLTVYTKHTKLASAGIYSVSSGTSNITADNINITAVNDGSTANSKAFAINQDAAGGTLNIGTAESSLIHLESNKGEYTASGNDSSKNYAVNAVIGKVNIQGKTIELVSSGVTSRAVVATTGGTVTIGNQNSNTMLSSNGSKDGHAVYGTGQDSAVNVYGQTINIASFGGETSKAVLSDEGSQVSILGKTIELVSSGDTSRTVEATNGGTVDIGNQNSYTMLSSNGSSRSLAVYGTGQDSTVNVYGQTINIASDGAIANAVLSYDGSQVNIGQSDSAVTISSKGTGEIVGLRAVKGVVTLNADTLAVTTENTSENGYSVGLMARNDSEQSERPEDGAAINITANQTDITSDGVGISAYSNSQVNMDTGLTLTAPTAIETRGNSLVNINPNNDKTVVINGDVSFATAAVGSGQILNAEVNINLSGAQSSWTGNIKLDYPTQGGAQTEITDGVTLTLSNQAQWTPTKVVETGDSGQTVETQALRLLKLNDGIVNISRELGTLEVAELQGSGGVINAEAAKDEAGNLESSTVKIGRATSQGEAEPALTVNYTGITADDLTSVSEDMQALADQTIQVEEGAVAQTLNVEEGNLKGAVTSTYGADGTLQTSQARNAKLADFGAINAMALVQWRNEINHLTKRLGDIRASESALGAWARVYGGQSQWSSNSEIEMDHTTVQVGGDYRINSHWIAGGAFSYTDSDADLLKGQAEGDSYSLAAYATYMADGGSYLDLIARYGYLDNELTTGNMNVDTKSNAFSLSVETGHMFRIMQQAYIEPQIELTYGFISGDDATASNGVRLEQDDFQSLVTRVGVRTGFDFPENAGTFYAMLSYSYDFLGDADGTASQGGLREALSEDLGGGWVSYGVGAQFKLGDNAFAYGELERTSGGEVDNPYLFNVGLRWNF